MGDFLVFMAVIWLLLDAALVLVLLGVMFGDRVNSFLEQRRVREPGPEYSAAGRVES